MKARHEGSVNILVFGGQESTFTEGVFIPNDLVAGAVEDAIKSSGLFARVTSEGTGDYRIEVALQRVSRPVVGLAMESQLGALWVLKAVSPERVIWQDLIVTTGAASVGDAFVGFTRAKMAISRAASNNIQRAIQEMSLIDLQSGPGR
jgi:hypothetical protein